MAATTPEKRVKERIKKLCATYGAYYAMPVMQGMASNGTPDFLLCHRGQFAGVEAKAGKGKPTKLQLIRLREIVEAGGTALVINEDNLNVLEDWLIDPGAPMENITDWGVP